MIYRRAWNQLIYSYSFYCEENCITEEECTRIKLKIVPLDALDKVPSQADGTTSLDPVGAVIIFNRGSHRLHFHGYVVKRLSQPILCSLPFMEQNDLTQNISNVTKKKVNKKEIKAN